MAKRDSLGVQFNTVIGKRIRQLSYKKTLSIMTEMCQKVVESFLFNEKYFKDVTGNTVTSFSAAVFYKGKKVYDVYAADYIHNPRRKTLRKGEKYDLPFYYDGITQANAAGVKTYVGEFGHGGQWGPTLGKSRISRMRSRVRDTWNLVAICPVEYAEYNEKIFKSLYETYEMFPDLFTASVIYARSQDIKVM